MSGLCCGEDLHNHVWVDGVGGPHYGGHGGVGQPGSPTTKVGPSPTTVEVLKGGGFPAPQNGQNGQASAVSSSRKAPKLSLEEQEKMKKNRPKQRFFFGHSAEVTCLAFNRSKGLCASGQKRPRHSHGAEKPFVCIWRSGDFVLIAALVFHERGICSLGFAPKGDILVTLGLDERIAVWHEDAFQTPGSTSTKAG